MAAQMTLEDMHEIGIEGGSRGRMTDVLRDAKDIASLSEKQ